MKKTITKKISFDGVSIAGNKIGVCEVDKRGQMFRMPISRHGVKTSSDGGYIIFVDSINGHDELNQKQGIQIKQLTEALEIAIQDLQDTYITSQDGAKGCVLCRLNESPLCACVTGEPTPTRCFNALKKQYIELGVRDYKSKEATK